MALRTDYTNETDSTDTHPTAHNDTNVAVNALQTDVGALDARVDAIETAPPVTHGVVYPEQYGAVGNDIADDGPAFNAMFASGAKVFALEPGRTYRIATNVAVPGNADYITINGNNAAIHSAVTSGTAFAVNAETGPIFGLRIDNVRFLGGGGETILIYLGYALDAVISRCLFRDSNGIGVQIGRAQNLTFFANEVRNNRSWGVQLVAHDGAAGQTTKIVYSTFVSNGLAGGAGGIDLGSGGEHIVMCNQIESHNADANSCGIRIIAQRNKILSNVFEGNTVFIIFGTATAASANTTVSYNNFIGGELRFVNYSGERIVENIFADHAPPSATQWTVTFALSPTAPAASTWWRSNSEYPAGPANNRITNNAQLSTIVYEQTYDNVSTGNKRTFVDGDTSPDIRGFSFFVANNSAATSIATFDGGADGQLITVRAQNANTTLVHSTSLVLKLAATRALKTNETVMFINDNGNVWRETPAAP